MANLIIYHVVKTSTFYGTVTVANSVQIRIVAGQITQNFYGFGLTYSQNGAVTGGTLTGTDLWDSGNGGLQYQYTGLNHPAVLVYGVVTSGGDLAQYLLDGNDFIAGSPDDDILVGYAGADSIQGGAGNDYLNGTYGDNSADTLSGGAGDDLYVINPDVDTVVEAAGGGIDGVISEGNYTLPTEVENLLLSEYAPSALRGTGNAHDNILVGNSGNNTLDGGAGNDVLDGGGGIDTLIGGSGDDIFVVDTDQDTLVELSGGGTDLVKSSVTITLAQQIENLTLTDTNSINGTGNVLANRITGNDGNNVLDGGAGADTLVGGLGDDTYVIDNVGDSVVELSGQGIETLLASVTVDLHSFVEVENVALTGSANLDATGNALNNIITGNTQGNTLYGMAGNDTLSGGLGADQLDGGDGADMLDGGDGTDTLTGGSGNDQLLGGADADQLDGGDGADVLDGGDGNDVLQGGTGNDILMGGAGNNTLSGGLGDDSYLVSSTTDRLVELAGGGIDTVRSSVTFSLSEQIENLELSSGNLSINGTGNALANRITGNDGNNVLDGGTGADTLVGSLGNDTYVIDNAGDTVVELSGQGIDTVLASLNVDLRNFAEVENLTLAGSANLDATGNEQQNIITGNEGNNTLTAFGAGDELYGGTGQDILIGTAGNEILDGGIGADVMRGGQGYDVYWVDNVGDVVIEVPSLSWGDSNIVYSSVSYTLPGNVESLTLVGNQAIDATALQPGDFSFGILTGNDAANVLTGGHDMYGRGGDDTLVAGDFSRMYGGTGNDTYVVGSNVDTPYMVRIEEFPDDGVDTVIASVDIYDGWTLSSYVENLTLMGFGGSGYGNESNNTIVGNAGDNVINGGAGADTMQGGSGNDTYTVDNAGDVVIELADGGKDTVFVAAGISYSLVDSNVEVLFLGTNGTSTDVATGTGNQLDNTISSWGYAPVILWGSGGNDTLTGGMFDDQLFGDIDNDQLSGGAGADVLDGGDGADVLNGGDGNDKLMGGAGNDTLFGDAGNDTLDAGAGNDFLNLGNFADYYTGRFTSRAVVTGGAGADQFVLFDANGADFTSAARGFSSVGAADRITDFNESEGDRIVTGITDGYGGLYYAPKPLIWYGTAASDFHATPGQSVSVAGVSASDARFVGFWTFYDSTVDTTVLYADSDSDGMVSDSDFRLDFTGSVTLGPDSFSVGTFRVQVGTFQDDTQTTAPMGNGNDEAYGLAGNDTLNALGGDDKLSGDTGNDVLYGGDGNDAVFGGAGNDAVYGNAGDDKLYGGAGSDTLQGGDGADELWAVGLPYPNSYSNTFVPDAATDINLLNGGDGNDQLYGGDGTDNLFGDGGNDTLSGGAGADQLVGGSGNDFIDGGDGDDSLAAAGVNDSSYDTAFDSADSVNELHGGNGNDILQGNAGQDSLDGGTGADQLYGGAGNDNLQGGTGDDTLDGGSGSDIAVYSGNQANYTVINTGSGFTVRDNVGADGTDTLTKIEALKFADMTQVLGKNVDILAYSWKAHTLLGATSLSAGSFNAVTTVNGTASFATVTDPTLTISASRSVSAAEASATSSAVNLQDAIAILKMIVGLNINPGGKPLSPYQTLAADYDGNGSVGLNDAIGVLKHVVGLSSPEPAWHFVNEVDMRIPGMANLNPGSAPSVSADLNTLNSTVRVGLVGYLSGDVDGSYAGPAGALDLDDSQPAYFVTLVTAHPELSLTQFGVYA